MESQPQNPEYRINPENFHPCQYSYFLTGGNVLCPWTWHFIVGSVQAQPRMTGHDMTEKLLTETYRIKTKQTKVLIFDVYTVKPVLSGPSKIDKTKVL